MYIKKELISDAVWEMLFCTIFVIAALLHSATPVMANTYSDVKGHWAEPSIEYVTAQGLFTGVTETEFKPNQPITRGMLISVLGRLAESAQDTSDLPFWDVDKNAYYAPYVAWAADVGIISGIGNGQFAPDAPITREQLCIMLVRYAKLRGVPLQNAQAPNFADASAIDSWSKKYVATMQASGLIAGSSDGNFYPKRSATRAEAAVILETFLER